MKIPVGVSRRHAHLTKETYEKLFGHTDIEIRNNLNQPGEYASTDTIDLKWENNIIERVRIIGPFRNYNQIEISKKDAEILNVNLERKKSGDIKNTHPIILKGPKNEITLKEGLVMALKHIHMDEDIAKKFNFKDDQEVEVYKDDKKLFNANIKLKTPSFTEIHVDEEEAKEFNLKQNDGVIINKIL